MEITHERAHELPAQGENESLKLDRDIYDRLRKQGLRPTSARVCILQILIASPQSPLTAENVFRELIDMGIRVSLGTIYRVLQDLTESKLLLREWDIVKGNSKSRFVIAPAILPPVSYLFVCRTCQRNITVADPQLSEHLYTQAKAAHFDQQLANIAIQVTCNACAALLEK